MAPPPRRLMALRLLLVLLVLLVATTPAARGELCAEFSLEAPSVVTLFRSPTNASEAVVLSPNCSAEVRAVVEEDGVQVLHVDTLGIVHVDSYPSAYRIFLDSNVIQTANFSNDTGIEHLILAWNELTSLDGIELPPRVYEFDLEGNVLESIAEGSIPDSVGIIYIGENNILSMDNFYLPDTIEGLYLGLNRLTSAAFTLPSKLKNLYLDSNTIAELSNITFPDTLETISCQSCGITKIQGVEFPAALQQLNLTGNRIATFEIRESDVDVFQQLAFSGTVTQTVCEDSSATTISIQDNGGLICVISDSSFNEKYTSSGSGSSESSSSSSSHTILIACLAAVGGLVVIGALVFGYRKYSTKSSDRNSSSSQKPSTSGGGNNGIKGIGNNEPSQTPPSSALGEHPYIGSYGNASQGSSAREYLSNDIRNDEALVAFRIAQEELQIGSKIATGGHGTIFKGIYRGQEVAIKQLRSENARSTVALKAFMSEIRMCAGLEHPRIVAFVGVSWSTLVDVAVVMEYMPRGDLASLLRAQAGEDGACSGSSWFEDSDMLRKKLVVALQIVEALVYLHSFDPPIVHRDIKARNVLLTEDGNTKLSDFGVSRSVAMLYDDDDDDLVVATMTGEIGTVAWMAPEVLQGRKYAEQADIYSFGVLLVELDTCLHPYDSSSYKNSSDKCVSQAERPTTSTQLALLIAAGELAPSVSSTCPQRVAELAARCLAFDPAARPSAVQIHYELRRIAQTYEREN